VRRQATLRRLVSTAAALSITACAGGAGNGLAMRRDESLSVDPRPEVCTMEYLPACARLDSGEPKTYANACGACPDQAVVAQLKETVDLLNAIRPTVAMLMPDVAERFNVMQYAGDAEDWALASHEMHGIEHLLDVIQKVDSQKGSRAKGFIGEDLEHVDAAIEPLSTRRLPIGG